MADLLSWVVTHSVALAVGVVIGAGSLSGAQLVFRRIQKGRWFGPVPAEDAKPK